MRIIQFIITAFTKQFEGLINTSIQSVMHDLMGKSRKALLIVISSLVFAALLTAGLIILVLEVSAQIDTRGGLAFSALLISSLLLSLISLTALCFLLWPRKRPASFAPPPPQQHQSSPLEETLAFLLKEGIDYLKERDKNKPVTPTQSSDIN